MSSTIVTPLFVRFPGIVLIDTREQLEYQFTGLKSDARYGHRPLIVPTLRCGLPTGDYSLAGHQHEMAVERKSISDLWGTLGSGRDRFEREMIRFGAMRFGAIVVEAEWAEILEGLPGRKLTPKVIFRTVVSWQQRWPNVHWWFLPDRLHAEVATFRILQRWLIGVRERTAATGWEAGAGI